VIDIDRRSMQAADPIRAVSRRAADCRGVRGRVA